MAARFAENWLSVCAEAINIVVVFSLGSMLAVMNLLVLLTDSQLLTLTDFKEPLQSSMRCQTAKCNKPQRHFLRGVLCNSSYIGLHASYILKYIDVFIDRISE